MPLMEHRRHFQHSPISQSSHYWYHRRRVHRRGPKLTATRTALFTTHDDITDITTNDDDNVDMAGWTIDRVIKESIQILRVRHVQEAELSVYHLLASSLQLPWESGFRQVVQPHHHQQQLLTVEQAHDFATKLQRRMKHEPIQYILGQWDFLDYTVAIRSPLLCPRPETEELVMMIVNDTTQSPVHILDVGCGTGVIGISLADMLTDATVRAIDIEPVAIQTSNENAKRILGSQTEYRYQATLASAENFSPDRRFDVVVSNPPYIPQLDMKTLSKDVLHFESEQALCGGVDGMDVIRTIIRQLPNWCNPGGICWMEVDPTHPQLIQEWLEDSKSLDLGVKFESSYEDLYGKERFVKLSVQ